MRKALALVLLPSLCSATATFTGLGSLANPPLGSMAAAVSGDGNVVIGHATTDFGSAPFIWTKETGMKRLPLPSDYAQNAQGTAINASGTLFGFRYLSQGTYRAALVNATAEVLLPEASPDSPAFVDLIGLSDDGRAAVGRGLDRSGYHPVAWVQGSPVSRICEGGALGGTATGISAAGDFTAGFASNEGRLEAFRAPVGGKPAFLGVLRPTIPKNWSRATGISSNGEVVVGTSGAGSDAEAFRWTQSEGLIGLGEFPGGLSFSEAKAVSADGEVIVGFGSGPLGSMAFIWTKRTGFRSLQDVLTSLGSPNLGWSLEAATGISESGHVVVGHGINADRRTEAWRIVLPENWIEQLPPAQPKTAPAAVPPDNSLSPAGP